MCVRARRARRTSPSPRRRLRRPAELGPRVPLTRSVVPVAGLVATFLADVVDVLLRVHEGAVGERAVDDTSTGSEAARVRDRRTRTGTEVVSARVGAAAGAASASAARSDRDGVKRVASRASLSTLSTLGRGRRRRVGAGLDVGAARPQGAPRLAAGRRVGRWPHAPDGGRARDLRLGLAAGLFTLDVARDDPGYWFAGASTLDAAVACSSPAGR